MASLIGIPQPTSKRFVGTSNGSNQSIYTVLGQFAKVKVYNQFTNVAGTFSTLIAGSTILRFASTTTGGSGNNIISASTSSGGFIFMGEVTVKKGEAIVHNGTSGFLYSYDIEEYF